MAKKLLLVLYSPILRELLLLEKSSDSTAIYLPLSTEAIKALLDLLAKGRTFSSKDAHLLEVFHLNVLTHLVHYCLKVVEAGALLGPPLSNTVFSRYTRYFTIFQYDAIYSDIFTIFSRR